MKLKPIWCKSKWSADDLDEKTIEFQMPVAGWMAARIGELSAIESSEGLIAVQIVTDAQGKDWAKRVETFYSLPQAAIDRIVQHPDQTVAHFRLE